MVDWFMPILLMAGLAVCFISLLVVLIMTFMEEKKINKDNGKATNDDTRESA